MSGGIGVSGVNNLGKEIVPLNTGWVSFAAGSSFTQVPNGGTDWNTPENALIEDGASTSSFVGFGLSSILTDDLLAQELAANPVPVDATIVGVEVRYVRQSTGAGGTLDSVIQLIKNGAAQGDNKSAGAAWNVTGDREDLFGGPLDMWGITLTPAEINAAVFGVKTVANGTIDFGTASINIIQMKIHYTQ